MAEPRQDKRPRQHMGEPRSLCHAVIVTETLVDPLDPCDKLRPSVTIVVQWNLALNAEGTGNVRHILGGHECRRCEQGGGYMDSKKAS